MHTSVHPLLLINSFAVGMELQKIKKKMFKYINQFAKLLTLVIAVIQLIDFTYASIETQDYLGSGEAFKDAPREMYRYSQGMNSLSNATIAASDQYHYHSALSRYGHLILEQVGLHPENYIWGSAGYYDVSKDPHMDMCTKFKGTYANVSITNARLVVTREKTTFIRPFTYHKETEAAWSDTTISIHDLQGFLDQGYVAAQRGLDVRMSDRLDFINGTGEYELKTKVSRFYGKSFCDGCQPMAELALYLCSFRISAHVDSDGNNMHITVKEAANTKGTFHHLGLMFFRTQGSIIGLVTKFVLAAWLLHLTTFLLAHGIQSSESRFFLAKQKDGDPAALASAANRNYFMELLLPEHYACNARPFTMSFVMYNSDIVVYTQATLAGLTMITSLAIERETLWWAHYDMTFRSMLTLIAINSRILWIYLGIFKACKAMAIRLKFTRLVRHMVYRGYNFVIAYILCLFTLDLMLESFYMDRFDSTNDPVLASSLEVPVFDGYYLLRVPGVLLHTVLSVLFSSVVVIGLQALGNDPITKNSLYKTFVESHCTAIWDPDMVQISQNNMSEATIIKMDIATLMNLKWFLGFHTFAHINLDEEARVIKPRPSVVAKYDELHQVLLNAEKKLTIKKNNAGAQHPIEHILQFYIWLRTGKKIEIA